MLSPKVFRGYRKNASVDLAEIRHSFLSILFTPILKISDSGEVRSRSYDVMFYDVMFYDVMFYDVRLKSADFAIFRIWMSFIAFWSVFLHCRQHNWCLWISRSHIQLPPGSRLSVPRAVSVAHFSRYSSNFTAILSLRDIG